jgi:citrate synthase
MAASLEAGRGRINLDSNRQHKDFLMAADHLTATEAAAALGISVPTLYAYVSRGLITSHADGTARARLYRADEVQRLARRRGDGKRAGKVAQQVLDWGVPVLESRLTLVEGGRLSYRGQDAIALAGQATLEDVAALLWGHGGRRALFSRRPDDAELAAWRLQWRCVQALPPLDRAMALLPVLAAQRPGVWMQHGEPLWDNAVAVLRLLAAALVGREPSAERLDLQLARGWGVTQPKRQRLLRRALVVSADHELNASTFTVRCIASTGAHLFSAVAGGLAAISGPRHGGENQRVAALIRQALEADHIERFWAARLDQPDGARFGPRLPGFGHPLYPQGDPRGRLLLDGLADAAGSRPPVRRILDMARVAAGLCNAEPTIDFGLAALEVGLALPPQAALSLFTLGRSVGWVAHALEQIDSGQLIRPRARYVG